MQNKKELALNIIIIFLLFFSYYSTLIVGLSWDEIFHYINGQLRFEYLKTFGEFKNYNYSLNIYYPGLYDTIAYFTGYIIKIINNNFFENYFIEIKHTINFIFGSLSVLGLYKLVKVFFNKKTAYLSCILIGVETTLLLLANYKPVDDQTAVFLCQKHKRYPRYVVDFIMLYCFKIY
mgnify:CR=1 FL=1